MAATEPAPKLSHPVPPAAKKTGSAAAAVTAGLEALVPDVIPRLAKQVLGVTFQRAVEVRMGNTLTSDEAATEPVSIAFQGPSSAYYTVMMVDPDAPSRTSPRLRHWRHWLVINVPNSCDTKAGDTVTEYTGPSPPKGSGLHRYAFLVYSQGTNRIAERDAAVPDARGQFNVARFVADMKLGDPLAANFFLCERN